MFDRAHGGDALKLYAIAKQWSELEMGIWGSPSDTFEGHALLNGKARLQKKTVFINNLYAENEELDTLTFIHQIKLQSHRNIASTPHYEKLKVQCDDSNASDSYLISVI